MRFQSSHLTCRASSQHKQALHRRIKYILNWNGTANGNGNKEDENWDISTSGKLTMTGANIGDTLYNDIINPLLWGLLP